MEKEKGRFIQGTMPPEIVVLEHSDPAEITKLINEKHKEEFSLQHFDRKDGIYYALMFKIKTVPVLPVNPDPINIQQSESNNDHIMYS